MTLPGRLRRSLLVLLVLALASACEEASPPTDASADAQPVDCDESCDDGLFCNGDEICTAGTCASGPPACDAGERCDEAGDRCVPECAMGADLDGDGVDAVECGGTDCDDADPSAFPGAPEICDDAAHDEDCDPTTLGDRDLDGDGATSAACCNGSSCGTDCDDSRAAVRPGSVEACNRLDDDCDGAIDEGVDVALFVDADADGRGDPAHPARGCAETRGFSIHDDDCNDANVRVNGAQAELCDAMDNDCDGSVDEMALAVTWYRDADSDGFGNPGGTTMLSCAPVPGFEVLATDCDDTRTSRSPRAPELCNGIDDDCNGQADFEIAVNDREDDDRDGLPDAACVAVGTGGDCDDRDPGTGPGATEICNGRDDDCDGLRDDACVACVVDAHCPDGLRCSGNACVSACGPDTMCPAGRTCCGGACVDTSSNAAHCGGCERECSLFGARSECVASACEVLECSASYGDCDGEDANGCEVNIQTSLAHCGGCGSACSLAHATPTCAARSCRIASCEIGWDDCDGEPGNGCETDIQTDALHCGACGMACSPGRGATVLRCDNRVCRVNECAPGLYDCNGNAVDGCEVQIPPPDPACRNLALVLPVDGFPAWTNSAGIDTRFLHDGGSCSAWEYSSASLNQTTIDLGPGPHTLRRVQVLWGANTDIVDVYTSPNGTTYTLAARSVGAPPSGVLTVDFAAPLDARFVRVVPTGGFYLPWRIGEIAIWECP